MDSIPSIKKNLLKAINLMKVKYYGHSCFGLESKRHKLLFDPFIRPNELAKNINLDTIPCDFMLISHGHEDHVADAEEIAKRTDAKIISNFEIVSWFGNKGLENAHGMNHGGKYQFDFGMLKYVNAIHSSMLPDGSNGGNPGGFIGTIDDQTFYYAGDTALFSDMKLIGELNQPDFAFLPIGDNFTMGVDDALIAADFIGCKKIIGMHYDTFPPIKIDQKEAIEKFKQAGKELILINIGDSIEI